MVKKILKIGLIFLFVSFSCATFSKFTPEQHAEFERTMASLNTPEKVNEWLLRNFTYDYDLYYRGKYSRVTEQTFWNDYIKWPIETYFDKKGVCYDAANLAGYALTKAGYEVKIVTARDKFRHPHTVCAFKRDGKWWICGDTRNFYSIAGPFNSIKEVALYIVHNDENNLSEYFLTRRKGF